MDKKIVLITGCSSGFGMLTALRLSIDKRYYVYASMRNLEKKDNLLKAVKDAGGFVDLLQLDVTKKETIIKSISVIQEVQGRLDVLVNNAGYGIAGFFEDLKEDEIRDQIEVNFFGIQNVIRATLPLMHKTGNGKIINLSSIAGLIGYPGLGAYNTSKWALEGFSESLRLELLPFGIKVLLVEPGSFQTKIFEDNARLAKEALNEESKYYKISKWIVENRKENLKKIRGNPDNVAKLIVKLINKKNPPFRTMIGKDAKLQFLLKRILPRSVFEKIVTMIISRKK